MGCRGTALGEGSHFLGYDGKTSTGFPSPGGFDGSVESKDVGLEGNFINAFDDLGYLIT